MLNTMNQRRGGRKTFRKSNIFFLLFKPPKTKSNRKICSYKLPPILITIHDLKLSPPPGNPVTPRYQPQPLGRPNHAMAVLLPTEFALLDLHLLSSSSAASLLGADGAEGPVQSLLVGGPANTSLSLLKEQEL